MSISGVSLSSLLSSLIQNGSTQTTTSTTATTSESKTTLDGVDSSPAYLLSLGQEQSKTALLGYSDLGKLVGRADASLAAIDQENPAIVATFGNGTPLQERHRVYVHQLAQAQIVESATYASPGEVIAGTGTLTIQGGTYDSSTQNFSANADPVTIAITDGSLAGIAEAINAADIGLTAAIVEGTDGGYRLQVTGLTGAANAFKLSGIAGLDYDPAATPAGGLEATQSSADAIYTVDGGALQSSWTNTGVAVTAAISADLTAIGAMTVSVPFGFNQAFGAAQTLASTVNSLLAGIADVAGTDEDGPASQFGDVIGEALAGVKGGPRGPADLAAIGITVQDDGTLSVDAAKLQAAYGSDPAGTRGLLDQAADAIRQVLSGAGGASSQIDSQIQTLVQTIMAQMPSLADFLNLGDSSGSSFTGLFGSSDQSNLLQTALGGSSGLAAALAQSGQGQALLSALNASSSVTTSDDQDEALLQALTAILAGQSSVES